MERVNTIARELKKGKIAICPTDTVYGLLADATNKKAVEKVFKIKKRQDRKPLPIFIRDIKTAKNLAKINKKQEAFLKKVWPGKTTAVLNSKGQNANYKIYGVDRKKIALRIPKYKLVLDLLKKINKPLTGTSANISNKPASTKIKEVLRQFKNGKYQPDLVINSGDLPKGKPSTVIDLTTSPPKILRI